MTNSSRSTGRDEAQLPTLRLAALGFVRLELQDSAAVIFRRWLDSLPGAGSVIVGAPGERRAVFMANPLFAIDSSGVALAPWTAVHRAS